MRYAVFANLISALAPTLLISPSATAQSFRPATPVCSGPEIEPKLAQALRANIQPELIRDARLESSNFVLLGREGYRWLCQATITVSGRKDHQGKPVNPYRIPEILYWVTRSEDGLLTVSFDASQLLTWVYINHGLAGQLLPPATSAVPQKPGEAEKTRMMVSIQHQLHRCWEAPVGAKSTDVVRLRVSFNVDGRIADEPRVVSNGGALGAELTRAAIVALRRCQPISIPEWAKPLHSEWREVVLEFSGG